METKQRKFRLGTRRIDERGRKFQYAKIDYGVIGKIKDKTIRNIQYMWIPTWLELPMGV